MAKKIYFDSHFGMEYYALVEDGVLCEYSSHPSYVPDAVGNVYKGRVTTILNGMQAAFVDCGLERRCYISVDDLLPESKTVREGIDKPKNLNLSVGDEVIVQVVKPSVDKKGAKVTTHLSFTGKYIVYMPNTPFIGISKKFSDEELKRNLASNAKRFLRDDEGLIVRTAAPYALIDEKKAELSFFRNTYKSIVEKFESATHGELLFQSLPDFVKVLNDTMLTPTDEVHVGNKELFDEVKHLINTYHENERPILVLHDEHEDMLYKEGIASEIINTTTPNVQLENGAFITINRTEALTVIDVNTGKFTGNDNYEDTVFCTNILAAREIARQVRLRNIGGLFVVDFIDMQEEEHRQAIVKELENCFAGDTKGRCKFLPMSKFGLVEFTRRRTTNDKVFGNVIPCPHCEGGGHVRSPLSVASEFRAKLLEVLHGGERVICVDLNHDIAQYLLNNAKLKENIASLYPDACVYIVPHRAYKQTAVRFRKTVSPDYIPPDVAVRYY